MKGIAANRFAWSSETGRPAEEKTLEIFIKEAAEAGYDAVECIAEGLAGLVKTYKLKVCGGYVGGSLHLPWSELNAEENLLNPARSVTELHGDYLNVNCSPKGSWSDRERKTEDELKRQGENLSRLAREVKSFGLKVLMHNHANRLDLHSDDLRSVTDYADAAVGVCLDTGWAIASSDDPVDCARRLDKRLGGVHLRNQRKDIPVEWLGEGDMDLASFVRALKEIGYAGWLTTELWHRQDMEIARSLLEDQKMSVQLLRKLVG